MASVRKRYWRNGDQKLSAWVVDYNDNGGRRRQRTFKLKKDADHFLAHLLHELAEGAHVPARQTTTVQQACMLRLERVQREGLEQSTYDEYEQISRVHIIPLIGNVKLNELTKVRVEIFRDQLLATRSYDRARRTLSHLKMTLEEARRLGKIAKNVAEDVNIKNRRRHEDEVIILPINEFNDFIDAAEDIGPREHAFAQLLMHGLRSSEIRGLPWKFFNHEEGTVFIGQRADRRCKIGPPKTKKSRRLIHLMPEAIAALEKWKRKSEGNDLVFPTKKRAPYYYGNLITQIFDPIMFRAGLTAINEDGQIAHRYSLHPFRHTAASIWIEQGFSPKRVSLMLGHSSIQVTFDLYGHLIDLKYSAEDMMRQLQLAVRRPRETQFRDEAELLLPGIFEPALLR